MRILAAELTDFRNLEHAELRFSPQLTAFVGPNGQGKTNLLEALYYVAALRPLRNVTRGELIRSGAKKATIDLTVESEESGLVHRLRIELRKTVRHLEKDEKRAETRAFLGHLVAVSFTPDDLQLTKGSPDGRRRFTDRAILNTRPSYLDTALRYARAVKARNKVLQDDGGDELLVAYEQVIAAEGAKIACGRASFIDALAPRIEASFDSIARPAPSLSVRYGSTLGEALIASDPAATQAAFSDALERRRKHDRHRRTTTVGPHRDDLEFLLDGQSVKTRASQGQHRAVALAIKLAEIGYLSEVLREPPVLLLDDISSELDQGRSGQLFEAIGALRGQVILTTTDETQIPRPREAPASSGAEAEEVRVYDVDRGQVNARDVA